MHRVLFVGDINVDVIMGGLQSPPTLDREVTCESYDVTMGSTAVISACAYSSLGGEASFLGLAGRDKYGEFMMRGMLDFGIDIEHVRRTSDCATGVTVNLIYKNTRSQVTYPGTIAEFDGSDINELVLACFDHIHLAGPYQQKKFRPQILGVLQLAREVGVSTSLDPQWDPAEQWEHMDEWLPLLTYFFLNSDEALSYTRAASEDEAFRRLAARTNCPILKMGERGAMLAVEGRPQIIPSYQVELVDTTGAGDTFDAAFLFAQLEKEMSLTDSVKFANAAAARSCTFRGGTAAHRMVTRT
ncbi:MAG: carbohydrate kinase family protein [Acidobacteriota bacterium]